jgi:hypothetical protein
MIDCRFRNFWVVWVTCRLAGLLGVGFNCIGKHVPMYDDVTKVFRDEIPNTLFTNSRHHGSPA